MYFESIFFECGGWGAGQARFFRCQTIRSGAGYIFVAWVPDGGPGLVKYYVFLVIIVTICPLVFILSLSDMYVGGGGRGRLGIFGTRQIGLGRGTASLLGYPMAGRVWSNIMFF